jgi:hypothetical protein
MAPEMIKHSQYSIKSDAWAFAVTLMEIVTHDEPYPGYQSLPAVSEMNCRSVSFVVGHSLC